MKVLNSLRFCVDIVSQDMRDSKVAMEIKLDRKKIILRHLITKNK